METILILAAIGLFIGAGALYTHFSAKKRTAAFAQQAENLGLEFSQDNAQILERIDSFSLCKKGRRPRVRNVLTGDAGDIKISIFDYQYSVGSGKNKRTPNQTVILLESPNVNAPLFSMRTQNVLDKFGKVLGFQDIDFETHPVFSGAYVLQGPNEQAVRTFFTPALLEFFETMEKSSVEGQLGKIIIYRHNTLAKPASLKENLASAYEVYGRIVDQS